VSCQFWSGLLGNVIGAFAGAVFTIPVAVWQSRRERKHEAAQARDQIVLPFIKARNAIDDMVHATADERLAAWRVWQNLLQVAISPCETGSYPDLELNRSGNKIRALYNEHSANIMMAAGYKLGENEYTGPYTPGALLSDAVAPIRDALDSAIERFHAPTA